MSDNWVSSQQLEMRHSTEICNGQVGWQYWQWYSPHLLQIYELADTGTTLSDQSFYTYFIEYLPSSSSAYLKTADLTEQRNHQPFAFSISQGW